MPMDSDMIMNMVDTDTTTQSEAPIISGEKGAQVKMIVLSSRSVSRVEGAKENTRKTKRTATATNLVMRLAASSKFFV